MSVLDEMQDEVIVYRASGGSFGRSEAIAKVGELIGLLQTMSAAESQAYQAKGQRRMHRVFFTTDPEINADDWLKVTSVDNYVYHGRVVATDYEGSPSHDLQVWNVVCEDITQQNFPAIAES